LLFDDAYDMRRVITRERRGVLFTLMIHVENGGARYRSALMSALR